MVAVAIALIVQHSIRYLIAGRRRYLRKLERRVVRYATHSRYNGKGWLIVCFGRIARTHPPYTSSPAPAPPFRPLPRSRDNRVPLCDASMSHFLFLTASTHEPGQGWVGNTETLARRAAEALPTDAKQTWLALAGLGLRPSSTIAIPRGLSHAGG